MRQPLGGALLPPVRADPNHKKNLINFFDNISRVRNFMVEINAEINRVFNVWYKYANESFIAFEIFRLHVYRQYKITDT